MWDWAPIRDWLSGVITPYWTFPLLLAVQTLMVMVCLILTMAFYTLAERKVIGWIQARKGPNRIGGLVVLNGESACPFGPDPIQAGVVRLGHIHREFSLADFAFSHHVSIQ